MRHRHRAQRLLVKLQPHIRRNMDVTAALPHHRRESDSVCKRTSRMSWWRLCSNTYRWSSGLVLSGDAFWLFFSPAEWQREMESCRPKETTKNDYNIILIALISTHFTWRESACKYQEKAVRWSDSWRRCEGSVIWSELLHVRAEQKSLYTATRSEPLPALNATSENLREKTSTTRS